MVLHGYGKLFVQVVASDRGSKCEARCAVIVKLVSGKALASTHIVITKYTRGKARRKSCFYIVRV